MSERIDRRTFMQAGAAASVAAALPLTASQAGEQPAQPPRRERVKIGIIGCGGMGGGNHNWVNGEEVIAICDVDTRKLAEGRQKSPNAREFRDFRQMIEQVRDLEAVVVSTPDHTHAVAAVMAMKAGLHVYCEKPLTHSLHECRVMRDTARNERARGGGRIVTQMGNRGTIKSGFRRGVELLQAGVLGPVTEVHIWSNRPIWPQGMANRPPERPVPDFLNWDLWLGPAPERPYGEGYHTFAWRGWWDFGTGALGDMACHTANQAFMGLRLGMPTAVEAITVNGMTRESPPTSSKIRYDFPARGEGFPACRVFWYDGNNNDRNRPRPPAELTDRIRRFTNNQVPGSGALFIGERGILFAPDDYATRYFLDPDNLNMRAMEVRESLPRARRDDDADHVGEWINAIKGGPMPMSNFEYACALTEFVLLGNVALRLERRIEWNSERLEATNCRDEAAPLIRREYRRGWSL